MVEFVSRYEKFEGLEYDPRIIGHGAVYGSSQSGKSHLVKQMALNGMFRHCKTLVFLNGKCSKIDPVFVQTMKLRWDTLVYSYQITSEPQLIAKINEIEDAFLTHRSNEYKALKKTMPEEVDMRLGMEFANLKIVMDDLHKEVVKSETLARKFQSVRHSGIELLFVTQSFKNVNMHDLIKENLMYVIMFKLSQNKVTLNGYLSDLSMISSRSRATSVQYRSSLEYIYNRLVQMNDSILGFATEETCYLYIAMPKRTCKKVSDVRTAITNPNTQICFKEIDCNSCKILFAERKIPLDYKNRMKAIPMRVLSEQEQSNRFRNADETKDTSKTTIVTASIESEDSPFDIHKDVFLKGKQTLNRRKTAFSGFSGGGNNNNNNNYFGVHSNCDKTIKEGGSYSNESDTSYHSDSTEIPSEVDEMFYKKSPPCRGSMNELYKRKSTRQKLTHSITSTKRERRNNKEKRRINKRAGDGRSFRNNQIPVRKSGKRNFNRKYAKLDSYKSVDNSRSNSGKTRKERNLQAFSTPSNSDSDE